MQQHRCSQLVSPRKHLRGVAQRPRARLATRHLQPHLITLHKKSTGCGDSSMTCTYQLQVLGLTSSRSCSRIASKTCLRRGNRLLQYLFPALSPSATDGSMWRRTS